MIRDRLTDRRAGEVVTFELEGRRWVASLGRFADGRLAEVLIDAPKESPLDDAARESAILAGLALQLGCGAETACHSLDGRDAGPIGTAFRKAVEK